MEYTVQDPVGLMGSLNCKPIDLFVICDILRDNDDELALVVASLLARHGFINMKGVVANYTDPIVRARAAKGALKLLGLEGVPVAPGTACRTHGALLDYETQVPYLAAESELFHSTDPKESAGMNLMRRTLENADDKSITMLCISGLTDMADLLRRYPRLVRQKVARVVIMGGMKYEAATGKIYRSNLDLLEPDDAANNEFDWFAAYYVHAQLVELGVPMTVVSKDAAYAAQIPFKVYDEAKDTDHPIGARLATVQYASLQYLWLRTWLPMHDPWRALPERCTPEWFRATFLDGRGEDRTSEDSIWDLAAKFQLYDPMALVACFPECVDHFYRPMEALYGMPTVVHRLIGPKDALGNPPVRNSQALVSFLCSAIARGLAETRRAK